MRIGVVDLSTAKWTSAGEYTKAQLLTLLLAAKQGERHEIVLVTARKDVRDTGSMLLSLPVANPPAARWLKRKESLARLIFEPLGMWRDPRAREWETWARAQELDVVLSFDPPEWWGPGRVATCSLIQDFQHKRIPEFFSAEELLCRDEVFGRRCALSDIVVVSSQDSRRDLAEFFPGASDKVRVFNFPSILALADNLPGPDMETIRAKYAIEKKFLLVMNQFWMHKNHEQVVEAMGILRQRGKCPQMVMIGQLHDYRDPQTATLSRLLSRIAELRLDTHVKMLGFVTADVRDALLRSCQAIVQPSRCEGWSTAVEDGKTLGRPVIASDIPVHREQVPDAFGFFDVGNAETLADLMQKAHESLPPGPDPGQERRSHSVARERAMRAGRELVAICRDAMAARDRRLARV